MHLVYYKYTQLCVSLIVNRLWRAQPTDSDVRLLSLNRAV